MAPGQGRGSDPSKLVAREHPLIVQPDSVKKEPETMVGRELKNMMQGDQTLLHTVSNARGHADANRPNDWTAEKMIIGLGTGNDGKAYNLGLGIANSGGNVKHALYLPMINKVFISNKQWTASRNRVKVGWEEDQSDIFDHRVKLAYWVQEVRTSDGTTIPAYKDVGLNKEDTLTCYKNWLVRLYAVRYPRALLGPKNTRTNARKNSRSKQVVTDDGNSPPPKRQKKRQQATTATVEDASRKKTRTSTRAGVRSKFPVTDEDDSETGDASYIPSGTSLRRPMAFVDTPGVFAHGKAVGSYRKPRSETYDGNDNRSWYTGAQSDFIDERPFTEIDGGLANTEHGKKPSFEDNDYEDEASLSGHDHNDEMEFDADVEASLESQPRGERNPEFEEDQESQLEDELQDEVVEPGQNVLGGRTQVQDANNGFAEDLHDQLNAQFWLYTNLEWWHAFNNRMARLDADALSDLEVCHKIGNGYLQARGTDFMDYVSPPPQVLRAANNEAIERRIFRIEDTSTFHNWRKIEDNMAHWLM
ncbi:hypothetical protein PRZ48_007411 [Zasmidium cellare]|uniref:Uncharacterized protein n=1 Tax=Zasmidium cellare TaxID=395010 RepID=A0ABR0EJ97_ZASCE|nr:hypothetical protein PRZ48_007411 [Zasmidium cellare]